MQYPMIWDEWLEQDSDRWLSWESIILLDKLQRMPVLDSTYRVLNQYIHQRHNTSCTKFAPYTVFCSIWNHDPSFSEIDEIEKKSLEMWWAWPWNGRSMTYWFDACQDIVNTKYPSKKVSKRKFDVGGKVWDIILNKKIPVWVSIIVDSVYRNDVTDGNLNWSNFQKEYGHADCIQQINDTTLMMIDSVGGKTYTIQKDLFYKLINTGNIRNYWFCFIPSNILNMPELSKTLPLHITTSQVKDSDDRDIIIAWETEVSAWISKGGDLNKLYKSYLGKNAITRMLMDLRSIRGF